MTISGNDGLGRSRRHDPWLAFAISLIYCVTVDRDVDAHEVGVFRPSAARFPDLIEVGPVEPVPPRGSVCPHP